MHEVGSYSELRGRLQAHLGEGRRRGRVCGTDMIAVLWEHEVGTAAD